MCYLYLQYKKAFPTTTVCYIGAWCTYTFYLQNIYCYNYNLLCSSVPGAFFSTYIFFLLYEDYLLKRIP